MSVGVGRGRGRLPPESVDPPRRPSTLGRGSNVSSPPPSMIMGNASMQSWNFLDYATKLEMALSNPSITTAALFTHLHEILLANPSSENMGNIIKRIFEKSVSSSINVECLSKCIYLASKNVISGKALKHIFFGELQKRYEGCNILRDNFGSTGYWRFVSFFSAICHFNRNLDSPPFIELIDALLDLIQVPPNLNSVEEVKTFVIAVVRYCQYARQTNRDLEKALIPLRQAAWMVGESKDVSVWITAGLESAVQVNGAPPATVRYYSSTLGHHASLLSLEVPPVELPACFASDTRYNFSNISYNIKFL